MTLRWIASPATVSGLMDALFEATLSGKVTGDTPITYVSICLQGDKTFTANIYVPPEDPR